MISVENVYPSDLSPLSYSIVHRTDLHTGLTSSLKLTFHLKQHLVTVDGRNNTVSARHPRNGSVGIPNVGTYALPRNSVSKYVELATK